MRRGFWVAVGLGVGVTAAILVSRWMRRQSEKVSPANIGREVSRGASDFGKLVRAAISDGRNAMQAKEREMRSSLEDESADVPGPPS